MNDIEHTATGALAVLLVLALTVVLGGTLYAAFTTDIDVQNEPFEPRDGRYTAEADELTNLSVVDTTGYALGTGPQPGGTTFPVSYNETNVSLSAHVRLNESGSVWMDRRILDLNDTISLSLINESWVGCHERPSGGVCLSEPVGDAHAFTHLGMAINATHASLIVDGTTVNTSSVGSDTAPVAETWYGAVDELRLVRGQPTAGQWSALASQPIEPTLEERTHARAMFDEGSGTQTQLLHDSSSGTLTGSAFWDDGLSGQTFTEGVDYALEGDNTIIVNGSSRLATLPVAYITYDGLPDSMVLQVLQTSTIAVMLTALALVALPIATVIAVLSRVRGGSSGTDRRRDRFQ